MDLSAVLMVMTALSVAVFAIRLVRSPARQVVDWWATMAVVVALGGGAWVIAPMESGYVAFAAMAFLVFAPLRIDRAAQRAARAGVDGRARVLARIAAVLHPFGAIRARPAALAAIAAIRSGGAIDDLTIERAGAGDSRTLREWYDVQAMGSAADHMGIRAALAVPARRARLLQLGLGVTWVRTVAETMTPLEVVDAVEEAERYDTTLDDPDRRALLALEAFAGLGDVEGAERLASLVARETPRGYGARAIAAARRSANDAEGARTTIEAALAQRIDPAVHRSLLALRASLDDPERANVLRRAPCDPRAAPLLARLRAETEATALLAPLREGSRTPSWATWTIALAITAWFLVIVATGDATSEEHLDRMGGLLIPLRDPAQSWRLLSATLVHAGWIHFLLNVYALLAFGRFVESFFGRVRFLAIYVAAAVVSGMVVSLVSKASTLVGASGAIFGLGGAIIAAVALRADLRRSRRGREELLGFAFIVVLQTIFDRIIPAVSGTAHLAGLATGALFGALLLPRKRA